MAATMTRSLPAGSKDQDAADVLAELARRTAEFRARPEPPAWEVWARLQWADLDEHGMRYAPSDWFGTVSEAQRVRYLRAIKALARTGLLQTVVTGRRLTHVKLTADGERAAAELKKTRGARRG